MSVEIEPLDPETWFERVGSLLSQTCQMDGEAPDSAIRQAYYLVQLASGPIRILLPPEIDEQALEHLLECAGYESAVMALIGPTTSFSAEKIADDPLVSVTMTLAPSGIVGKGHHKSCAKAMLNAWAECLVNFGKAARDFNLLDQVPRKFQPGQHQSSTEH